MLRTKLMPLRHTVGDPIEITNVRIIGHSEGLRLQDIQSDRWREMSQAYLNESMYAQFLPAHASQGTNAVSQGSGVAVMTEPSDLPYEFASFCSLRAMGDLAANDDASRKLWVEFEITLDAAENSALIGGICYGGYPYTPYYITAQGENSSNFGLPREIRVSWRSQFGEGFLDDEMSLTQQEQVSHSGVHIFTIDPIKSDRLLIRLSDFPRIITDFDGDRVVERWGFIIPYLSVFTYRENTRFQAHVPAGMLAAVHKLVGGTVSGRPSSTTGGNQQPANRFDHYYFGRQMADQRPDVQRKYGLGCTDYLFFRTGSYFPCSGASMLQNASSRRSFALDSNTTIDESFGSALLARSDEIHMFFEQSEEYPRCIAGMRIALDNTLSDGNSILGIPVNLRVYEVDPPEGVSPLMVDKAPDQNKYATLVAKQNRIPANSQEHQVHFLRPSTSRYFLVVFQARVAGHLFVNKLEFIQSVHVTLTPRPSRKQRINAMHFRLIGPELAEDYAHLGSQGFSLSVEHTVAGQTKNVLFSANSLLDLLQTGQVRLFSNQRRRRMEKETYETQNGSYGVQHTASRGKGWVRSETGDEVEDPDFNWLSVSDDDQASDDHSFGYTVIGNQETRHHLRNIINRGGNQLIDQFLEVIEEYYPEFAGEFDIPDTELWTDSQGQFWPAWNGIDPNSLRVAGNWNATVPPGLLANLERIAEIIDGYNNFDFNSNTPDAILDIVFSPSTFSPNRLKRLMATNGFGINLGIGFVVSGSVSANLGVPTIVKSGVLGTSGSIGRQASKTNFSYSQYLNNRADQARTRTEYPEGKMIRHVTREAAGNDADRIRGAEVMWQENLVDIVTGTIPLRMVLPATADKFYQTTDQTIRVRFGSGFSDAMSVDIWFDVQEELVRDDY